MLPSTIGALSGQENRQAMCHHRAMIQPGGIRADLGRPWRENGSVLEGSCAMDEERHAHRGMGEMCIRQCAS